MARRKPRIAKQAAVFRLRVTLRDVEPPVWRALLVSPGIDLYELHQVIQVAMRWSNSHLHQFETPGAKRTFADPETDFDMTSDPEDEHGVELGMLLTKPGGLLSYEYDFGDGWELEILLEETVQKDPRFATPLCVGGARACPPDDCGGPYGYQGMLEALASPEHPSHDEQVQWIGGFWDPEAFDANEVNRSLRELRQPPPPPLRLLK
ncbi:MAG TPA: plasmid pRiA4b ORF-3 family protein [Myxococcales bacterium]|jgi:hypothetical protein